MSIHKTKKIAKNNKKIDWFWEVKKDAGLETYGLSH